MHGALLASWKKITNITERRQAGLHAGAHRTSHGIALQYLLLFSHHQHHRIIIIPVICKRHPARGANEFAEQRITVKIEKSTAGSWTVFVN